MAEGSGDVLEVFRPLDGDHAAPELTSAAIRTLGGRLKRLRKLRGLTLEELAAAVGMSHSFLSMLENGRADISLGRLERLGSYYGIPLAELLTDHGLHAQPDISALADGQLVDRGEGISYRLFPERPYLGLQLIHIELSGHTQFNDFLTHKGYDVLYVSRGTVVLLHAADQYILPTGTLASYSASAPHSLANERSRTAEVFAITTPPYW